MIQTITPSQLKQTWRARRDRHARKEAYDRFYRMIQRHSLTPLISERCCWDKLERDYLKQESVTSHAIDRMVSRRVLNPAFLVIVREQSGQTSLHWMNGEGYERITSLIISLLLEVFTVASSQGLLNVIQRFKTRQAGERLRYYQSFEGLGPKRLETVFEQLEKQVASTRETRHLEYFLEDVFLGDGIHLLKKVARYGGKLYPQMLGKVLSRVIKTLPDFDQPRQVLEGLALMAETSMRDRKKGVNEFFSECLRDTGCHLEDLKAVVAPIYRQTRRQMEYNRFKKAVRLLLQLQQAGVPTEQRFQVFEMLKGIRDALAAELYEALLWHCRQETVDASITLAEAIVFIHIKSGFADHNATSFRRQLGKGNRNDSDGVFLQFCHFIAGLPETHQTRYYSLGMWILSDTDSLELLDGFRLFSMTQLDELDRSFDLGLWISLSLHAFLQHLLQQHGYCFDQYQERIQKAFQRCGADSAVCSRFLRKLKEGLQWGMALEDWLDAVLSSKEERKALILNLEPAAVARLEFRQVESFLHRYTFALYGSIPLKVSDCGTPFTNGSEVFLPESVCRYPDSRKDLFNNRNASLYVASVFHEIGFHILAGSFLADAQPTLERFHNKDLAHSILNIMEDFRGRHHFLTYGGYPENWTRLVVQDERQAIQSSPVPSDWRYHFLQLFAAKAITGHTSGELNPENRERENRLLDQSCLLFLPPDGREVHVTLQTVLNLIVKKVRSLEGRTVAHSLLLVEPIYDILAQVLGEQIEIEPIDGFPADMGEMCGEDAFELSVTSRTTSRNEQLKELGQRIQPCQPSVNVPEKVEEVKRQEAAAQESDWYLVSAEGEIQHTPKGTPLKIWQGQYNHLTGREVPCPYPVIASSVSGCDPEYEQLLQDYQAVFQAMERALRRLRIDRQLRETEGREPEAFLVENLIEAIADPHAIPFIDLYENEQRVQKEEFPRLEVKILVDASGSTAGTILRTEKVFALATRQAFEELDAEVEVYFFEGYKETRITRLENPEAIGLIKAGDANRDGAAIRYVAEQFHHHLDRSLLILITDGMPCAHGYDNETAVADTCHAMKLASEQNIMVHYFNVGGLPQKVFDAFKKHCQHTRVFKHPNEMVRYAPRFVRTLINELSHAA